MSYLDLTISEIHQALLSKKVTPLELTKEAIQRAKEDSNNAFEIILEEKAIEKAESLGEPQDNLFWGIPYVAKDNISTKDIPTTGSSNILNGYVPLYDASIIERLNDAGAILIGKATLDELAMGGTGTTGHLGITYNPWDKDHKRLVGGSSCGSAASVAAGVIPFSLGSDTGDSVRKPASYAGLVGFKPTWGRIPRFGLFPFAPSLDHVGYFTRSVEDAASLLEVLAGHDDRDMTSSYKEVEKYSEYVKKDCKDIKIGVCNQIVDAITDLEVKNTFLDNVKKLQENGVSVTFFDFDVNMLKAIFPAYFVISCSEATSCNANLDGIKFGPRAEGKSFQEVMMGARSKGFSELIKRRFVIGSYSLMRDNQDELFNRSKKVRRRIVNAMNNLFEHFDILYGPAAPSIAPEIGSKSDALSNEYLIADNHLAIGNFGGFPSLTLPIGIKNGMPFGGNVTGRAFEDGKVFQIAKLIEDITGLKNISVLNKGGNK